MTVYNYAFNKVPQIKIEVDLEGDGSFSAFNSRADITSRTVNWTSKIGYSEQFKLMADKGTATIVFDNTDNFWTTTEERIIGSTNFGTLYGKRLPYCRVRIQFLNFPSMATPELTTPKYDFTSRTFQQVRNAYAFYGFVESVEMQQNTAEKQLVTIQCFDMIGALELDPFQVPAFGWIAPHALVQIVYDHAFGDQVFNQANMFFRSQPADGDAFQILFGNDPVPYVYHFKTTLSGADNEVKLGATLADTITNAYHAFAKDIANVGNWSTNFYIHNVIKCTGYTSKMLHWDSLIASDSLNWVTWISSGTVNNLINGTSYFGSGMALTQLGYGTSEPNNSLYWALSEPSGTTAVDESGNSLVGTYRSTIAYSQPSPVPTIASAFMAAAGSAVTRAGGLTADSMLIKFLFKKGGAIADGQGIFELDNNPLTTALFRIEYATGNNIRMLSSSAATVVTTSTPLAGSGWFEFIIKVAFTVPGTFDIRVYCFPIGTVPKTEPNPTVSMNFSLGSQANYQFTVGNNASLTNSCLSYFTSVMLIPAVDGTVQTTPVFIPWIWNYFQSINNQVSCSSGGMWGSTTTGYGDNPGVPPIISLSQNYIQYPGNGWNGKSTTALDALKEITQNEFGRSFVSRSGVPMWYTCNDYLRKYDGYPANSNTANAHRIYGSAVARGKIKKDVANVHNSVSLTFTPRSIVGASMVKVAQSGSELQMDGSVPRTISIPLLNPDTGQSCSVSQLRLPLTIGTDFHVRNFQGTNYDTQVGQAGIKTTVVLNGGSIDITFQNVSQFWQIWINSISVYGIPISIESATSVTVEDSVSIGLYGRKILSYTLPQDATWNWAYAIANYLLSFYSEPHWFVSGDVDFGGQWIAGSLLVDDTGGALDASPKHWWHLLDVELMDAMDFYLAPPLQGQAFGNQNIQRGIVTGISYSWTPQLLKVKFNVENIQINQNTVGNNVNNAIGYTVVDDSTYTVDYSMIGL